ncbi:MAG: GGDEF domain-containing protein [Desulfurivibrio sp.]|nr:GGDEF domain-containing protein [Desulfurivibrio sp.]
MAHNLAAALERAQLFERMRREAMHDELTGLYNRRYLYDCGRARSQGRAGATAGCSVAA